MTPSVVSPIKVVVGLQRHYVSFENVTQVRRSLRIMIKASFSKERLDDVRVKSIERKVFFNGFLSIHFV